MMHSQQPLPSLLHYKDVVLLTCVRCAKCQTDGTEKTPADESGSASAAMKCSMEVAAELSSQALSPQHPVFAQRCAPGCFGATFAQYRDQQATHLVAVGVLLLRWRLVGVLVLVVWLLALLRGPL